ncbi:hypothetical protein [Amycolatopsis cihanbeyliensis]|uniref:hypothetical protein n=1 Tax=Amycolatopsis cihanbeyliensis TaxID=1128664 RepID=UPI001153D6F5|nr:hypothetical protein [Amycolatopsis cihanbeyliensis]
MDVHYETVQVTTFLAYPDGHTFDLVGINKCETFPDTRKTRDLLGSIEFVINGKSILDKENIEEIEYLWGFISRMTVELCDTRSSSTLLPDHPAELWFNLKKDGQVRVGSNNGERTVETSANKEQLTKTLRLAGIEFYQKLDTLSDRFYSMELRQLEAPGY